MQTLADIERAHILRILLACEGNRDVAARFLDIGRTTLYCKLRKFGIKSEGRGTKKTLAAIQSKIQRSRCLILPYTKEELEQADLKCPNCRTAVLLPYPGENVR